MLRNTSCLAKILHRLLSDKCWGRIVSNIFIYLVFSMGQQPYIPEDNSQMVVPSGHWCFSSEEKTSLKVSMRPLLLNAVSACCELIILFTFGSIPTPSSRKRFSVLLTNGMARCTRNTDEYIGPGLMHNCNGVMHFQPLGQQRLKSSQHTALGPYVGSQQSHNFRSGLVGQHVRFRHSVPSGQIPCNKDKVIVTDYSSI